MIFILDKLTVVSDCTDQVRTKLAAALRCPVNMVVVEWLTLDGGRRFPRMTVEFPAAIPPSHIDVNDPEQLAQWRAEVEEMPRVDEFLRAKGIEDPERVILHHTALLVRTAEERLAALARSTQASP